MNDHASACIEQIKRLGFKPGTQLNLFCTSCSGSLKIFSDNPDEIEIQKYLDNHRGHEGCFFGFNDGRRWKIQNDGGMESNEPQRIEPVIETTTPEEPLSKSNHLDKGKDVIPDPDIFKDGSFSQGAFLVSRSIDQSEVWFMSPIYLKAWIWMMKRANHQEVKQGDFVYCRGEFFTTYEEIRESLRYYEKHRKFKPSLKQSRIILDWFIANGMIEKTPVKRTLKLTTTSPLPHHIAQKIGSEKADVRAYLGLKIRLINFDIYQTLNNYRGRPKGRPQEKAKGRGGAEVGHYNKNDKNDKNIKHYVEGSDELRLSTLLLEEIRKNKPNYREPNLQAWAKEIDLILRRDNRSPEAIERVIRWAQSDHGDGTGRWKGWASNILSPGKLREKFDELEIKMNQTSPTEKKKSW
jgi:hypothetical protein